MQACTRCGHYNEDNNRFCGQCGTLVNNFCPDCSFKNLINQKFCGNCGKQLIANAVEANPPQDVGLKQSSKITGSRSHNPPPPPDRTSRMPSGAPMALVDLQAPPPEKTQMPLPSPVQTPQPATDMPHQADIPPPDFAPAEIPAAVTTATPPPPPKTAFQAALQASSHPTQTSAPVTQATETPPPPTPATPPPPQNRPPAFVPVKNDEPIEAVTYTPPVYGLFRNPRVGQIRYENVIQALTNDFYQFIGNARVSKGSLIALCASDGLGKSHILQMARLAADPDSQAALWLGASHYRRFHDPSLPLQGWVELMHNALGLSMEGHPQEEVRNQVERFLDYVFDQNPPETQRVFMNNLLSVSPLTKLDRLSEDPPPEFAANFYAFLKALSAKKPVILILEDIQYADAATLDVLTRLLDANLPQLPIQIVLTQSRDFYTAGPLAQVIQQLPYKEYVVCDLHEEELSRFLNDGPLGGKFNGFPMSFTDRLIQQAAGLPIVLEETLRLLHLEDRLGLDNASGKFTFIDEERLTRFDWPASLDETIMQRSAFLPEQALYTLQLASVLGEKFSISILMTLTQSEEATFNDILNTLYHHGFLVPDAVNTGRFRHGILWQTIYQFIPDDLKKQFHQLISQTLESDFNRHMTIYPGLIASHAERGQLWNRALTHWNLTGVFGAQVGQRIAMNMAFFHAMLLIEYCQMHNLPLQSEEPLDQFSQRILESLATFNLDADPDLALRLLNNLKSLYLRTTDESYAAKLLEVLGYMATAHETKGEISESLDCLNHALSVIDKSVYPLEYASVLTNKLECLYTLGKIQNARTLCDEELNPLFNAHLKDSDTEFYSTWLNSQILRANVLQAQCDPHAGDLFQQCAESAAGQDLTGLEITAELSLGHNLLKQGQYSLCDERAGDLLHKIEALEDPSWFFCQWGLLAMTYHCELGEWEPAQQLILKIITEADQAHDYYALVTAQLYHGYLTYRLGNAPKAYELIEKALTASANYRFAGCALLGWRWLSEVELSLGNSTVALEIAQNALSIAQKPDIRHYDELYRLVNTTAKAMMVTGNIKDAGKLLEGHWPMVLKTGYQPLIAETAASIGALYKNLATDLTSELSKKHLTKSVQFYQKALGIWLELQNKYQLNLVREAMPKI